MTILLTGSTGFLGGWISEALDMQKENWRPLNSRLNNVVLADLEGVHTVIHNAAHIPKRSPREEDFFEVNVEGTRQLLEQARCAGVKRFVYISSMGVKFPSKYAESKLAAEEVVKASGLEWLILRPAHVYGPNMEFRNLVAKLRRKIIWPILQNGKVHTIYVKDCASAIVNASLSHRAGETLNIVAPEISELSYYRLLRGIVGTKYLIAATPLCWARKKRGVLMVEIRTKGFLINGVSNFEFETTPIELGLKETFDIVSGGNLP